MRLRVVITLDAFGAAWGASFVLVLRGNRSTLNSAFTLWAPLIYPLVSPHFCRGKHLHAQSKMDLMGAGQKITLRDYVLFIYLFIYLYLFQLNSSNQMKAGAGPCALMLEKKKKRKKETTKQRASGCNRSRRHFRMFFLLQFYLITLLCYSSLAEWLTAKDFALLPSNVRRTLEAAASAQALFENQGLQNARRFKLWPL